MIYKIILGLVFFMLSHVSNAQEIGDIREMNMILADIPFSGDDFQPNFISSDTSEIISFNHLTWLDRHCSLYDFFHAYKDLCLDSVLSFKITMIYIPKEVYHYDRLEGYTPTGKKSNQWILTSILREDQAIQE